MSCEIALIFLIFKCRICGHQNTYIYSFYNQHKFPEEDSGGILSHYLLYTVQTLFKNYFIIAYEFHHCLWND